MKIQLRNLVPVVGWPQTELPLDACSPLCAKMPPLLTSRGILRGWVNFRTDSPNLFKDGVGLLGNKREGEEETLNIFMAPVGVREGGNKFPLEEMLLPPLPLGKLATFGC